MKKVNEFKVYDSTSTLSYDDYVENCNANGREPQEDGSDDYWEEVYFHQEIWREDFFSNIKHCKDNNGMVIITGSLGLWDGSHDIYPTKCDCLLSAVKKCWGSSDEFDMEFKNGVYYCNAYHHDGANSFEIRKLSAKGIIATDKWYGDNANVEVKDYWTKKFMGS